MVGTWRDGGNIHTYHGDPHLEWDELDYSVQPTTHTTYDGRTFERNYGVEYLVRMKMRGPDGIESTGLAHVEFFMSRQYERYQPTDDGA